jgi:sensor histidine kinase YesM
MSKGKIELFLINMRYTADSQHTDSLSVKLSPAPWLVCKFSFFKLFIFLVYTNGIAVVSYFSGLNKYVEFGKSLSDSIIFSNSAALSAFACVYLSTNTFKSVTRLVQVLLILVSLVFGSILGSIILAIMHGTALSLLLGGQNDLIIRALLGNFIFGGVIIFFFANRARIDEAKRIVLEERMKLLDMKNLTIETEQRLLQSHIEPHFLFNTLSNVMSLIDTNPDKARKMMEHFSDFLRASLHIARDKTVTIAQEMELIRSYLDIHRVRMGNRLSYTIDIPDSLLAYRIPPLLIQPLVENSLKHGLEPKIGGGGIAITGKPNGSVYAITIADSGIGIRESAAGNGIGLENIRKRIQMFSNGDGDGRLILEKNKPSGVKAILELPYSL